jgi:hypothetical protein
LKVYGAGEWHRDKHGVRGRRTWRKLHLAVDAATNTIVAATLTATDDGDASQVGPLLDQTTGPIDTVMADGAYDGDPSYTSTGKYRPVVGTFRTLRRRAARVRRPWLRGHGPARSPSRPIPGSEVKTF